MRSSRLLATLVAVPALSAPAMAQLTARGNFDPLNYSGLRGQPLTSVPTPGGIGGLVGVVGPTVMRPTATFQLSARVLEDRPGFLTIEVSYSGMPANCRRLNAVVTDATGTRLVSGVGKGVVNLSPGEADAVVTITLALDPSAPEGNLESKRLFIFGTGSRPEIIPVNKMFNCDKKWFKSPSVLVAEPLSPLPAAPSAPSTGPIITTGVIKMINLAHVLHPSAVVSLKGQLMRGGRPVQAREAPAQVLMASPMALKKSSAALFTAPPEPQPVVAQPAKPISIAKFRPEFISKLKLVDPATFARPSDDVKNDQGEGPAGANVIGFAERIEADPNFVEVPRALSITPAIYGDKNRNSGLFYYLPARYVLDFADQAFAVQMFYSTGEGGGPGEVNVSAILRAAINPTDLQIAELFLRTFCQAQSIPFKRLVPFFGAPRASLEAALAAQLSLPPDKVRVLAVGEGVVSVNFASSPDKIELFLARLTSNLGLSGQMSYTSSADPSLTVGVPMEVRLPDRNSLRLNLTPQNSFRNDSPFPVALKFLHVLRFTSGVPTVYTFDLPHNELPPGASVTIDRSKIPDWLTAAPSKMWMDFSVVPDAVSIERALQSATQASSGQATANVTIEKVGEFPAGVTGVTVVVTSRYFTPFGSKEETKEVVLGASDTSKTLGPLYPRGRQEGIDMGADNPYLKWQLKVTKEGRVLKTPLMTSNRLTLTVGAEQIGQAR